MISPSDLFERFEAAGAGHSVAHADPAAHLAEPVALLGVAVEAAVALAPGKEGKEGEQEGEGRGGSAPGRPAYVELRRRILRP